MMISRLIQRTGLLAVIVGAATSYAQTDDSLIPALQTAGAVQYTCGGIGNDESAAMRAAMGQYPLALMFARQGGEYLANMAVEVVPGDGPVIGFTATGPLCLIKLPSGHYTVKATTEGGQSQRQAVEIDSSPKRLDFRY